MIWETEGFTKKVLDGLLDPCVVLEPVLDGDQVVDFTIRYLNEAAALAAGIPRDELFEASIGVALSQAPDAGILEQLIVVHADQASIDGTLLRDVRFEPSRVFDVKAKRIEDFLLVSLRDVTEERVAIERLRLLVENLGRHEEVGREIRQLIHDRAFTPVFQPIVSLHSGEVVGYEALTRFASDRSPTLVFAEARAVGLGPTLEVAVARASLEAAAALPDDLWLSLNFSPPSLLDGFVADVVSTTSRQLVVEITEQLPIESYPSIRAAMAELGSVQLAVDDVGAGYAGFGHLLELSPDVVKLDLTLIRDIDQDPARQALTAGLRYFTNQTGTKILAEGVESEAEAATLRELGFDFGQGYLFGRPMPVSEL
jgi:EAL domain-containing protein (putative c-di-GMP-specific phosphodiesterase class I)